MLRVIMRASEAIRAPASSDRIAAVDVIAAAATVAAVVIVDTVAIVVVGAQGAALVDASSVVRAVVRVTTAATRGVPVRRVVRN